jgi:hypothetical protein
MKERCGRSELVTLALLLLLPGSVIVIGVRESQFNSERFDCLFSISEVFLVGGRESLIITIDIHRLSDSTG